MTEPVDVDLGGGFDPATEDEWRALVDKVLKGRPFESLVSTTSDGIEVQPLYRDGPDESDTGTPGSAPFTRSFSAAQRPAGRWDIRVEIADADPARANRKALSELERGATSLVLGGGCLASPESLERTLEGVHLDLASISLAPGAAFRTTSEWLVDLWASRGLADKDISGGFGADPIATLARTGTLPQGIDRALADGVGLAVMAANRFDNLRTWSIDTTPYAEAGASEAQELAAMLSTTVAYLRAMQNGSMDAEAAVGQLELTLGASSDFFTTIAKLRAARRVFAAVTEACGADNAAVPTPLVARTLDRDLSRRDPWVNLLRVTTGAFAAALGGADAVITRSFDSQLESRGALGARMARNTQLLLSEESGVGRVVDPAGGSWYVETLTQRIAEEAWDTFRVFEGAGGLPAVLLDGTLATRIAAVAADRLTSVADRRAPLTGVSEFPNLDETAPDGEPHREGAAVEAPTTDSATHCEPLRSLRWAEPYEALRDAADRHGDVNGQRPAVFLANLGPVASHTARASWAANLFAAGGLAASSSQRGTDHGFTSPDELAEDFSASSASIACICGSDETYAELGAAAAEVLTAAGAERVYLAGKPGDRRDALEAAGVDEFIHVGVDVVDVLDRAHRVLGIAPIADESTEVKP